MAYAARHPERVSHLHLCGAYAQGWRVWGNDAEIERREAIITLTRQGWAAGQPRLPADPDIAVAARCHGRRDGLVQ